MHTEEEAKKLWCPHTRITAGSDGQGHAEWHTNRPSHAEVHEKSFDRCIGSSCAAWRWEEVSFEQTRGGDHVYKGYCGLAGSPS